KLEERTVRLDQMRKELEETSLKNLEVRLAAEDALADLSGQLGVQRAQERVEEVRTIFAGQLHDLRQSDNEGDNTARMVAFTQQQLEEDSHRLDLERQAFSRRMNERERELQEQESRLRSRAEDWEQREARWRQMRDGWLEEKLSAEQIIRGLLDELSDELVDPADSTAVAA
ncbi:MAG: hypothetical protein VB858_08720, partial [Planctomycetaceae bacterium]